MWDGSIRSVLQMPIAIRQGAKVASAIGRVVARLEIQIPQVSVEHGLAIVVIDFAAIKHNAPYGQVKWISVGISPGLPRREIALTARVDDKVDHRMVGRHAVEVPPSMNDGENAQIEADVVDLQQRCFCARPSIHG